MKQTLLIITALMLIVGCSKDGIKTIYYENGQKREEGILKYNEEGIPRKDGIWTHWSPDGKESSVLIHSDGESWDGIYTSWYENGQKWQEVIYNNGKQEWGASWYENGQKQLERTFKDGKQIGSTYWYEDGNEY